MQSLPNAPTEVKSRPRRTATPEQKRAAEERRKRFSALAKQVAAMTDEQRESLAARVVGIATVEGHGLSLHNVYMIALQRPSATIVGGFRQWIKAGRAVRKGEHGMQIWVPTSKAKDAGTGRILDTADDVRFLVGTVFDVSQTDEIAVLAGV